MIEIQFTNQQSNQPVNQQLLKQAVQAVLEGEQISNAVISIAVVDDETIHQLNRQFLNHDYATDVLSFLLQDEGTMEGEVIVSADTAAKSAADYGWSAEKELLLYVVHGTLHLVGYDDQSDTSRSEMRELERKYLSLMGCPILKPQQDGQPSTAIEENNPGGGPE